MEKTLIILKPESVKKAIIGGILERFENAGLKIIGLKMMQANELLLDNHYLLTEEWAENLATKTKKAYQEKGIKLKESAMEIAGKVQRNGKINGWFNENQIKGYVLKADIKHYFEEVGHEIFVAIIRRKIKDEKVIWLIRQILNNTPNSFGEGGRIQKRNASRQSNFAVFCQCLSQ